MPYWLRAHSPNDCVRWSEKRSLRWGSSSKVSVTRASGPKSSSHTRGTLDPIPISVFFRSPGISMNRSSSCSRLMLESLPNNVVSCSRRQSCRSGLCSNRTSSAGVGTCEAAPPSHGETANKNRSRLRTVRYGIGASPAKNSLFSILDLCQRRSLPPVNIAVRGGGGAQLAGPVPLPPLVALLRRDGLRRQSPNASNQPTPATIGCSIFGLA